MAQIKADPNKVAWEESVLRFVHLPTLVGRVKVPSLLELERVPLP